MLSVICASLHIADQKILDNFQTFQSSLERSVHSATLSFNVTYTRVLLLSASVPWRQPSSFHLLPCQTAFQNIENWKQFKLQSHRQSFVEFVILFCRY